MSGVVRSNLPETTLEAYLHSWGVPRCYTFEYPELFAATDPERQLQLVERSLAIALGNLNP
ncbi:MAG: hypothetical protein HYW25_01780 [Candidatus Aenigmarchaeota archaeon]|nr:hypothetical protein [Candidatus Aenigmarchaeota archaeon]